MHRAMRSVTSSRADSRLLAIVLLLVLRLSAPCGQAEPLLNTYSIVAFDPATGDLGVAVESKYFGVGSVVPFAKAGVGAVATQAQGKMSYGPDGLALIASGKSAPEALDELRKADARAAVRQIAMIDAKGRVTAHTGGDCNAWAGHHVGENYSVQGNLLAGEAVITAMSAAFEKARATREGELAEWMMRALEAAQAAGGDRRGQQSAAILVVRAKGGPGGDNDRYIDIRIDDHTEPIVELARLLRLHRSFYRR
jgi:uncharacterized Ntn-hydrolase superfamily protein